VEFFNLLRREADFSFATYLAMAIALALSDVLILWTINHVVWVHDVQAIPEQFMLLFVVLVAIRQLSQFHVLRVGGDQIMRIIHRVRTRVIEKYRRVDMKSTELTDQSSFLVNTIGNVSTIGYLSLFVAVLLKDILQIVFITIYIYYLSPTQFLLVAVMMIIIAMKYYEAARRIDARMQDMQASDKRFMDVASDLMNGFKEVKMNRQRSDALNADIVRVSLQNFGANTALRTNVLRNYSSSEVILFAFLGLLIFIEPRITHTANAVVIQVAVAVTFMIGTVREAVGTSTEFTILGRISDALTSMETEIDRLHRDEGERPPAPWTEPFRSLSLHDLVYDNIDVLAKTRFSIGPANMELKAGEIAFLTGSNGSGKSTLLRVLCGLYGAHAGEYRVNDQLLTQDELARLRSLFSVVFADYYLFPKLHGAPPDAAERAERLIEELGLTGKTELKNGSFSTLHLSSGQRTRIALICALLEDRPIYVFDEWAADQDPVFRERFYKKILPDLRAAGKLVIAVTHDEAYFGCCDRLFEVRGGVPHEKPVALVPA